MLKAFMKRKSRHLFAAEDGATGAGSVDMAGGPREDPTASEDLLTSAVFERLAYLDPDLAWELLRESTSTLHGDPLPDAPPAGAPAWAFWPRLPVGQLAQNAHTVEPDVLVVWDGLALVFEAKHKGVQYAAQWVEEVRAVRAAHPTKRIWLIAVGGILDHSGAVIAAEAVTALGDATSLLTLPWEKLGGAVRAASRCSPSVGSAACLRDMLSVLESWGYRLRLAFDSFPLSAQHLSVSSVPSALPRMRS